MKLRSYFINVAYWFKVFLLGLKLSFRYMMHICVHPVHKPILTEKSKCVCDMWWGKIFSLISKRGNEEIKKYVKMQMNLMKNWRGEGIILYTNHYLYNSSFFT